jgi:hypothetical protein
MLAKRVSLSMLLMLCLLILSLLQGCVVAKAVDVAAGTAIGVSTVAVKTTGKVVGAARPDGDKPESQE